jgi:hypothetical protein
VSPDNKDKPKMNTILLFCKKNGKQIVTSTAKNETVNSFLAGILSSGIQTATAGKTPAQFATMLEKLDFDFISLENDEIKVTCDKVNLLSRIVTANKIAKVLAEYSSVGYSLEHKTESGKRGRKANSLPAEIELS